MRTSSILGLWMLLALGGCEDTATAPIERVVRMAIVDGVFAAVVTSVPTRVEVTVTGNFRDTCSELGDITQSRDGNRFSIQIMTTRPMEAVCSQVLVPFDTTVVLMNAENLPVGDYVVDVNGVTEQFTVSAGSDS